MAKPTNLLQAADIAPFIGVTEHTLPPPLPIEAIAPRFHFYRQTEDGRTLHKEVQYNFTRGDVRDFIMTGSPERIIFIVHGFRQDWDDEWMKDARKAIVKLSKKYSVVLVGWGKGAQISPDLTLGYDHAVANMIRVSDLLADRIKNLNTQLKKVGVGFSLGAHMVGLAGRKSNAERVVFDHIIALDPAGPLFEPSPEITNNERRSRKERRLNENDAKFVNVMHTDGYGTGLTPLVPAYFGTNHPMGDLDFYPNCGRDQDNTIIIGHSHNAATRYFIRSVGDRAIFRTTQIFENTPKATIKVERILDPDGSGPAQMGFWATRSLAHLDRRHRCYYLPVN